MEVAMTVSATSSPLAALVDTIEGRSYTEMSWIATTHVAGRLDLLERLFHAASLIHDADVSDVLPKDPAEARAFASQVAGELGACRRLLAALTALDAA